MIAHFRRDGIILAFCGSTATRRKPDSLSPASWGTHHHRQPDVTELQRKNWPCWLTNRCALGCPSRSLRKVRKEMSMIRIGIVGAGFWAQMIHIPTFQSIPGYEVVGLTSGSVEKAKEAARQFGIKKVYADYHELIRDDEIDVVDVCAPNCLHAEVTLESLAHDKDVICIKPLATSLAEAQRVVHEA